LAILVRCYRGAVQSRFDAKDVPYRVNATSSTGRALLDAAELLERYDIAPAGWAAFSCDKWKEYQPSRAAASPPRMNWVWSTKRLLEKHGWYHSEELTYSVTRTVFGPKSKPILAAYFAMDREIRTLPDPTRKNIQAVVERYFPSGSFEARCAEARAENEETRTRLRDLARRGEWLWGARR